MFKIIILIALIAVQKNDAKTIHKRQLCDRALDLTRVAGSCTQFHRCFASGFQTIVTCPTGYEFDTVSKSCKSEALVDCVPRGNECLDSTDYTKVANDCKKFYRCINGFLSTETCQDGLVYNPLKKACDNPKNVAGCEYTYWGNECDSSVDLTRAYNDCTKFYRCERGWIKTEACPNGMAFDNTAKACKWASLVPGCERAYPGNECDASVNFTRVNNECTKFYRCDRGWLTTETCPDTLVFDTNTKTCILAKLVPGCERTYWGNECDVSIDLTRTPFDCTKFFRCDRGWIKTEQCPSGLFFDNNMRRCEWPNTVSCTPVSTSQCLPDQDLTQVVGDCSKYYRCFNGKLTTETCSFGSYFDRTAKACKQGSCYNNIQPSKSLFKNYFLFKTKILITYF